MLTRRGFAGFASCAICAVTGFVATEASAQGAPAAGTPGVTRKILSQTDGPTPGYVTMLVEAEIEAGVAVARHTHPGIESAYVLEGGFELPIEGQPTRMLKPGDGFLVPAATPHAGGKAGTAKSRILIWTVLRDGIRLVQDVGRQASLAPFVDKELAPGPKASRDAIDAHIRATGITVHHPLGTCRMGQASDSTSVVDDDLRVLGAERLRVVDASVMPDLVGGNINAAVIMIAEKAADLITKQPASPPRRQ